MDIQELKRRAGIEQVDEGRRIKTDSETLFDILNLVSTAEQEADFDPVRMKEHLRMAKNQLNALLQSGKGGLF